MISLGPSQFSRLFQAWIHLYFRFRLLQEKVTSVIGNAEDLAGVFEQSSTSAVRFHPNLEIIFIFCEIFGQLGINASGCCDIGSFPADLQAVDDRIIVDLVRSAGNGELPTDPARTKNHCASLPRTYGEKLCLVSAHRFGSCSTSPRSIQC